MQHRATRKNLGKNILNYYYFTDMNWIMIKSIYNISSDDAIKVSTWINEENKLKKHMLEKNPADLIKQINNFGWVIAQNLNDEICWFMCLNKTKLQLINGITLYERWSLIVHENFRWLWLWNLLRNKLLIENKDKWIFTVTNVPLVIQSNIKIEQHMIRPDELKKQAPGLYKVIEEEWSFLEDDIVFVNERVKNYTYL